MQHRDPVVLRIGRFDVDLRAGELLKDGRRVRMQEQPFRVLEALVERPGEVVTREELRQRLWAEDTFVDFDNGLNNCVNKLRVALGDSAAAPRFIETVGRRGYRFIAPLDAPRAEPPRPAPESTTEDVAALAVDAAPAPVTAVRARGRRSWVIGAAIVSLITMVLAVLAASLRAPSDASVTSLAVLPLVSLSSDPEQEYFSDGMTDALITRLAGIRALRVISRQSTIRLKKTDKTMPQVGLELGADAVVEGTVLRTGSRVRVTVQLVHAATDRHLWSQEVRTRPGRPARAAVGDRASRRTRDPRHAAPAGVRSSRHRRHRRTGGIRRLPQGAPSVGSTESVQPAPRAGTSGAPPRSNRPLRWRMRRRPRPTGPSAISASCPRTKPGSG